MDTATALKQMPHAAAPTAPVSPCSPSIPLQPQRPPASITKQHHKTQARPFHEVCPCDARLRQSCLGPGGHDGSFQSYSELQDSTTRAVCPGTVIWDCVIGDCVIWDCVILESQSLALVIISLYRAAVRQATISPCF